MHADKHSPDGVPPVDDPNVEVAVEVFRLLSDATRIRMILALHDGELSVNRLAEIVDRNPASVSQHLAKMRWAKLVRTRQDGTRFFYRLADEHAVRLVTEALRQAEHSLSDAPEHHR